MKSYGDDLQHIACLNNNDEREEILAQYAVSEH